MEIGFVKTCITPTLDKPVYLAGFGQNRRAETVHDDLYLSALVIRDASHTLALCALDLIGFFRHDVQDVTRRIHEKAPGVDVLIASVHPHHGPDTIGMWGPDTKTSGVDLEYLSGLKDKIVGAILAALEAMQPVSGMKTCSIQIPGLVKNARDPEVLDNELTLLQFVDSAGQPLVSLFNFPCHPEVLWEHNPHITADYPGVLRKEVEQLTGAACIFFSADLGGMLTPDVKDHSFEEADFMGKAIARAGVDALVDAPVLQEPTIWFQKKELLLKLTNILFKFAIRRGLFPELRDSQGQIRSEVNLIKIGSLWLATIPGELFPKLGLALKADMLLAGARTTGVIGLANDELGYILPREDFRFPLNPFKPGKHYEETNSISKEIGPVIAAAMRELIHG